jgi:predicted dehydrogenase
MNMIRGQKVSRRRFLQHSGVAAFSAALPLLVPRSVFGRGPEQPGANDRIRLAIIGCGERGQQLSQNLPDDAQLVALCDCDLSKARSLQARLGTSLAVDQDYRATLDRADVDAVIVSTVDHHHVQAGILACSAGKDVYVEKPLSLYVREGRALVEAARRHARIVQTGTQQRTMEMNQFACEFVRDGGLGKVRVVEGVNFSSPLFYPAEGLPEEPVPEGLDWDLWQGQAVNRPFNRLLYAHWRSSPGGWWGNWWDYSGRQMTGMGAHAFDMIQYALGSDETGPVEFWPVESEQETRIHFRYASGVEVRLRFPDAQPYRGPRLGAIFVGERGKIEINRNKFTTNPPDLILHPPDRQLAAKWDGPGWIARDHVQNWLDCIRTRQRPNADVEIGHRTVTICHLCNITRQLGRRLHWDPQQEQFVGDEEANRLLDRPRRKGWELPA